MIHNARSSGCGCAACRGAVRRRLAAHGTACRCRTCRDASGQQRSRRLAAKRTLTGWTV